MLLAHELKTVGQAVMVQVLGYLTENGITVLLGYACKVAWLACGEGVKLWTWWHRALAMQETIF